MMWNDDRYYFGWPGMLLVMVVLWTLVGAGVYLGARLLGRDQQDGDPVADLDARLARGEISAAEHDRLCRAVDDRRPVPR
ncbi:MAG TPA: hypothetical protein VNS46_02645 [Nocardioides sp.]|nr:hypothetical protein [Nocardioides sp.]